MASSEPVKDPEESYYNLLPKISVKRRIREMNRRIQYYELLLDEYYWKDILNEWLESR